MEKTMLRIFILNLVFIFAALGDSDFHKLSVEDLKKGEIPQKKITVTEKVMSGIYKGEEKEIEVSYTFHRPNKIVQLPVLDDKINHSTNPVSALYSYWAFELEKNYEKNRTAVEDIEKKLEEYTKATNAKQELRHKEYVEMANKTFQKQEKRRKEIYDLSDADGQKKYQDWLEKAKEDLEEEIHLDKEEKLKFTKQLINNRRSHLMTMRALSRKNYEMYKKWHTALKQGILYLGTMEFEDNNKTVYSPIVALHKEDGKFLEVYCKRFEKSGNKYIPNDLKGNEIDGAEWVQVHFFLSKDLGAKLKKVLKIEKVPDLK